MAVTVSVPTILRTHTDGEKSVEASGATLAEVIDDLEAKHNGIKERLVNDHGGRRRRRDHLACGGRWLVSNEGPLPLLTHAQARSA